MGLSGTPVRAGRRAPASRTSATARTVAADGRRVVALHVSFPVSAEPEDGGEIGECLGLGAPDRGRDVVLVLHDRTLATPFRRYPRYRSRSAMISARRAAVR